MAGYFRCGDHTKGCERARLAQIVRGAEWTCLGAKESCQKEPVSWFEAIWHLHRKAILACIAGLAGLLLLLLIIRLMRPDALAREIAALREKADTLDARVRTMEAKPSDANAIGTPVESLEQMSKRAKDIEAKVRANVDSGNIAQARTDVQSLDNIQKQAATLVNAARNPAPTSSANALEVQQLITDLQDVEGTADALGNRSRDARRTDLIAQSEKVIEDTRDAMARVRRLVPRRTAPPPLASLETPSAEITALLAKANKTLATYVPPPSAPFQEKDATLAVTAASDLTENLIVPMLKARSGGDAVTVQGQWYYVSKPGFKPEEKVIVRTVSGSPYGELSAKRADLILSDAAPTPEESSTFAQQFPGMQLSSRSHSEIVALDALMLLANPDSTESILTPEKAGNTAWTSGPAGSPEHIAATRFGFRIAQTEDNIAKAVLANPSSHGLSLYHKTGVNVPVKRLAYQAGPNTSALKPSPFTIGTEDYKFSFRIIASRSPESRPGALAFVSYMTGKEGQEIVARQGYVDLGLHSAAGNVDPRILAVLGRATGREVRNAVRMSTNFRFAFNEEKLDLKGLADLERLPAAIAQEFRNPKVVILGFTDNSGPLAVNTRLAMSRAAFVATEVDRSIHGVKSAGLADQLPVDTNDTEEGRARNRRAEVWIVPD